MLPASRPTRRAFLASIGVAASAGCLGGGEHPLAVGVVPDVDPDSALAENQPLADYLAERLGRPVDLRTTADYAGLVQAMVSGDVDLAYYGGVSYVLAHDRGGARALVVGEAEGSTLWHTAFVTRPETGLETMADVQDRAAGLDLVFGDPISTSGTVMPTYYLRERYGLRPERDFASVTHVGAHDATARAIAAGSGDLGALNARIYDALRADSSVDGVVECWRTPGFPDYPWAVAPAVGEDDRSALRDAFVSLDDRDRGDILARQSVDRYVPVSHEAFTDLETAVELAGITEDDG